MTEAEMRAIISSEMRSTLANLEADKRDNPMEVRIVRLALDSAKGENDPKKLNFQFRQVIVHDASDPNAVVKMKLSDDDSDNKITLKQNTSFRKDKLITEANFSWEAQSGKWVELLFVVEGEFDSGRQLSINGGGVSINDGSQFTDTLTTLSGGSAESLLSANLNRTVAYITNYTGADLHYGDSSVDGSNKYQKLVAGAQGEWRSTAALSVYSAGGGDVAIQEHES